MEPYLGIVEDDELSHLSEKMTPVEFDRIALQYLKLKKVRYSILLLGITVNGKLLRHETLANECL